MSWLWGKSSGDDDDESSEYTASDTEHDHDDDGNGDEDDGDEEHALSTSNKSKDHEDQQEGQDKAPCSQQPHVEEEQQEDDTNKLKDKEKDYVTNLNDKEKESQDDPPPPSSSLTSSNNRSKGESVDSPLVDPRKKLASIYTTSSDDNMADGSESVEMIPEDESIGGAFTDSWEDDSDEEEDEDDEEEHSTHSEDGSIADYLEEDDEQEVEKQKAKNENEVQQEHDSDVEEEDEEDDDDDQEEEEEEQVSSFSEKQSLLILAAEHDRVDILKAILADDDPDRLRLMHDGIPPLHIAISFGSMAATQSLLRMGADPSIRPDTVKVVKQQAKQPEEERVPIPKIHRFHDVSAWELGFGNGQEPPKKSSWLFSGNNDDDTKEDQEIRVITPVNMAPSKREGIRHAFTAESLRCIGGDEVDRLQQLLNSGMPPSIDIGGKDLYGWAVEMGALKCEELLRPAEASKFGETKTTGDDDAATATADDSLNSPQKEGGAAAAAATPPPSRVLDRRQPGEESSVSHLKNRLDELESLAGALSTCLDNLAEEVSVCHGLLLMGGGASALASHVKSLRELRQHKEMELERLSQEWEEAEIDLEEWVYRSGEIGQEIAKIAPTNQLLRNDSNPLFPKNISDMSREEEEALRRQLTAQIGASENKIRKLRASIADLSEESARDLTEVERRGLSGGINLVRGLREELRDLDFSVNEARSMRATCKAKINLIQSKLPPPKKETPTPPSAPEPITISEEERSPAPTKNKTETVPPTLQAPTLQKAQATSETPKNDTKTQNGSAETKPSDAVKQKEMLPSESWEVLEEETPKQESTGIDAKEEEPPSKEPNASVHRAASLEQELSELIAEELSTKQESSDVVVDEKPMSEKIAAGESNAIVVRNPGNRGNFAIDLWQVLLRIIGFEARRSGNSVQQSAANLMIV